jgi:hypothetical protein
LFSIVANRSGVEKLDIAENQDKSGDRKCPDESRKSLVRHPDAMQFLRIFQQPQDESLIEEPLVRVPGGLSANRKRPPRCAFTQLDSVCSTTPRQRAADDMLCPDSTSRTASLNSSV